jgi:hypothetical protein
MGANRRFGNVSSGSGIEGQRTGIREDCFMQVGCEGDCWCDGEMCA